MANKESEINIVNIEKLHIKGNYGIKIRKTKDGKFKLKSGKPINIKVKNDKLIFFDEENSTDEDKAQYISNDKKVVVDKIESMINKIKLINVRDIIEDEVINETKYIDSETFFTEYAMKESVIYNKNWKISLDKKIKRLNCIDCKILELDKDFVSDDLALTATKASQIILNELLCKSYSLDLFGDSTVILDNKHCNEIRYHMENNAKLFIIKTNEATCAIKGFLYDNATIVDEYKKDVKNES